LIANNANGKSYMGRGSVRRGEALLAGLLRCRRCGKKLLVHYNGIGEAATHNYFCPGAFTDLARQSCITFGGIRVDRAVVAEVLERLQPLGIEAALAAVAVQDAEQSDRRHQLENALEAARYEASRAHRQYDAVDPENRLVASELERRWNEKLSGIQAIEEELARTLAKPAPQLSIGDRERLMALGTDLGRAWDSPGATAETKKKIIRIIINEIIVDVSETLDLVIHWQGGDHTELTVKKNKAGQNRWVTDQNVVDLVSALARQMPDKGIAAVLNRSGITTSHGHSWTRIRVRSLRQQKGIDAYREGERSERGEITLDEAAQLLSISRTTVRRMINANILPGSQLCKGAPWIIRQTDLDSEQVRREAVRRRERRPASADELQTTFDM
jgi:excisionase family DNA binding protein